MTIIHNSGGPLQCNCTILSNTETGKGYLIDPGGDPELIMQTLEEMKIELEGIYHTHAHFDHFLASAEIKEKTGAPIYLHDDDRFYGDSLEMQCSYFNIEFKPTLLLILRLRMSKSWFIVMGYVCILQVILRDL